MDNILNTLEAIRQQTSALNRVAFMFHCWSPFNNLCNEGFRIAAIQSETIPRLKLLPIVAVNVDLFTSTKSPTTNKVIPIIQKHSRPIEASYSIAIQRYGEYGMLMIRELDCSLEECHEYIRDFDSLMAPFYAQGGRLQDLTEYFGIESPVIELFDKRTVRVTTTFRKELDAMFRSGRIKETAYHRFLAACNMFARSAATAHRRALQPGYGKLQESITAVNNGDKARFDQADEFMIREFPDFNSDSKISKRSSASDTAQLTEVFKEFLKTVMPQGQPKIEAPVVAAVEAVPTPSSESLETREPAPVPPETPEDTAFKCQAKTKSGNQCSVDARPGFKSCINVMHQQQLGEYVEPEKEKANAEAS